MFRLACSQPRAVAVASVETQTAQGTYQTEIQHRFSSRKYLLLIIPNSSSSLNACSSTVHFFRCFFFFFSVSYCFLLFFLLGWVDGVIPYCISQVEKKVLEYFKFNLFSFSLILKMQIFLPLGNLILKLYLLECPTFVP